MIRDEGAAAALGVDLALQAAGNGGKKAAAAEQLKVLAGVEQKQRELRMGRAMVRMRTKRMKGPLREASTDGGVLEHKTYGRLHLPEE